MIYLKALYYVGYFKARKAINAFQTQQQIVIKLIPGFEAPVILAYSAKIDQLHAEYL